MNSIPTYASRFSLCLLLITGLLVTGCDSSGGMSDDDSDTTSATISGRATDEQASDGSKAGVEGATVTAVSVNADGTTAELTGEATTDANGGFTITVEGEGASDVVRLSASSDGGSSSSVIVMVNGQNEVNAQPITVETTAEADVYVEARTEAEDEQSHNEGVTLADVAAYVDANTAAALEAGTESTTDVATAIRNAVEAEATYHTETNSNADASAITEAKADAFAQLQADLATAADASAQANAAETFEATMGSLYANAGASAQTHAEARQVGTSHLIELSTATNGDAALGLRKQAELLRAYATAQANAAVFEAAGAAQTSLDALSDARSTLFTKIRAASSTEAIAAAKINYQAAVEDELEASFEVDAATIASAKESTGTALSTLETALADLASLLESAVETSVDAYTTFYADAQPAAEAAFSNSTDAEACASIVVMLEAF